MVVASILLLAALPVAILIGVLAGAVMAGERFVARQILVAVDQLANAILAGWADETISSRAWRKRADSTTWRRVQIGIDWTFARIARQPNHCEDAYNSERLRLQAPPELREGGAS